LVGLFYDRFSGVSKEVMFGKASRGLGYRLLGSREERRGTRGHVSDRLFLGVRSDCNRDPDQDYQDDDESPERVLLKVVLLALGRVDKL